MKELMRPNESIFIVIDLQDKLLNAIKNKAIIEWNSKRLVETCKLLEIDMICTEQNPTKLGKSIIGTDENSKFKYFSKMDFSCFGSTLIKNYILNKNKKNIVISGVETHICIQQTAFDLKNHGFNVFIASDAVSSRFRFDHKVSLRRMEINSIQITSTESIMFEWCKTADNKVFKQISALAKDTLMK